MGKGLKKIAVVGGGAAGMAAAISAVRAGAAVTVFERNDRVGKKILVTGNGKCNLGNVDMSADAYYSINKSFVERALARFGTEDTIAFFRSLGLVLKNRNGYLYPASEQAATVLDVLRFALRDGNVDTRTSCTVRKVERTDRGIRLEWEDGFDFFDAVIIACGGKALPKSGSDGNGFKLASRLGHSLIPCVPALVQLRCKEDYFKAIGGVRAEAVVSIYKDGKCAAVERGEIQFTEYGISGIPVFQLSRVANYILKDRTEVRAKIDLMPDIDAEALKDLADERQSLAAGRNAEEYLTGLLPKKITQLFIKLAGMKGMQPADEIKPEQLECFYDLCKNWNVYINDSNSFENAQVSAGGVNTTELSDNMESLKMPGIYFAGEIMDVDGKCGGYNLHWAWCTGFLAGKAAAGETR